MTQQNKPTNKNPLSLSREHVLILLGELSERVTMEALADMIKRLRTNPGSDIIMIGRNLTMETNNAMKGAGQLLGGAYDPSSKPLIEGPQWLEEVLQLLDAISKRKGFPAQPGDLPVLGTNDD